MRRRAFRDVAAWNLRPVLLIHLREGGALASLGAEKVFVNGKALDLPVPPRGATLVQIIIGGTRKVDGAVRVECLDGSSLTFTRTGRKTVRFESIAEFLP